jgi:hypothetical protein
MRDIVLRVHADVLSFSFTKNCDHSASSFRPRKETVRWTAILTGYPGEGIGMALTIAPSVARRSLKSSSDSKIPESGSRLATNLERSKVYLHSGATLTDGHAVTTIH